MSHDEDQRDARGAYAGLPVQDACRAHQNRQAEEDDVSRASQRRMVDDELEEQDL